MKKHHLIISATFIFNNIIAQVPVPDLYITNQNITNGTYIFGNNTQIFSPGATGTMDISGNAQVDYKAGQRIVLGNGFKASNFTGAGKFHAYIQQNDFDVVIMEPTGTPGIVPKLEKLELGVKLPQAITEQIDSYFLTGLGINPYDPDQISVEAYFVSPTGVTKIIPGFFYREYTSIEWPDNAWYEQNTDYAWRVRFAPPQLGNWTGTIKISIPSIPDLFAYNVNFNCVPSGNRGYLQVGQHKRVLKFSETGQSFFAIGQNIAWPWNTYPLNYKEQKDYIHDLHVKGGNYTRIVLTPEFNAMEWEKMGDYNSRQNYMWEMDRILELVHNDNTYLTFCIELHGQYQVLPVGDNSMVQWENHPYKTGNQNIISGINDPIDFFSNVDAQNYFKKRLRYIVARWGYSTNLSAYELMSEVDGGVENLAYSTPVQIWHINMADYIKNVLNDKNHLITTSYAGNPDYNLFTSPLIDITTKHLYSDLIDANYDGRWAGLNTLFNYNVASTSPPLINHKPTIMEEMGWIAPDDCSDWSFHNDLWATAFMGGYGAGLNWWNWENNNYRENMIGLKSFLNGIDIGADVYTTQKFRSGDDPSYSNSSSFGVGPNKDYGIESFFLKRSDRNFLMGWMHNLSYYWGTIPCGITTPKAVHSNEKLVFSGLKIRSGKKRAKYEIDWFNVPHTGSVSLYTSQTEMTKLLSGKLVVNVQDMFQYAGEYAYKVYLKGTRDLEEDDSNVFLPDTLSCTNDSLVYTGIYENDIEGNQFSYYWDFGNGITSDMAHPVAYFNQTGTYTVTLIVTDSLNIKDTLIGGVVVLSDCDTNSSVQRTNNNFTNPPNLLSDIEVKVVPNPNNGNFNVITSQDIKGRLYIYNIIGGVVVNKIVILEKGIPLEVNIMGKDSGIYFLKIISEDNALITNQKIIIY